VVRRYLNSDDITEAPDAAPRRWIIDFGTRPLEQAMHYPQSLAIIRRDVKPDRDRNQQRHFARLWWQFAWPRPEMRRAIAGMTRYVCSTLTGKRLLFVWADSSWCPSNATGVLALDDDYAMGVLTSRAHGAWAWAQSSTLKQDLRYTPSTAFETFPWPSNPSPQQRAAVAGACRDLLALRNQLTARDELGLTRLYNAVDEGAYVALSNAHRRLDEAVVTLYGWPKAAAQDATDLVRRLGELNTAVATGAIAYQPF